MMRKNSRISAGSSSGVVLSTVATEPLMEVSGARSSWLTMLRNSARSRSSSSSGARSCMVTTTDSSAPSAAWIGVELTSVVTLRPSGTESSISSARTVSGLSRNSWGERELVKPDLAPVAAPADHDLEQLPPLGCRHCAVPRRSASPRG